jgi:hypothetical protein
LAQHIPLRRNIRHHFLETFRMASLSHSSEMLQYHPQTVTCALSLPLLKPCTWLNTVLQAGAFCPRTADSQH